MHRVQTDASVLPLGIVRHEKLSFDTGTPLIVMLVGKETDLYLSNLLEVIKPYVPLCLLSFHWLGTTAEF